MRASFLLVLALALLVGLGVAVAVKSWGLLAPPTAVVPVATTVTTTVVPTVPQVVVPARNLYETDTIRPGDLVARAATPDELKDFENFKKDLVPFMDAAYYRFPAKELIAGLPLKLADLQPMKKPEPLVERIAPGCRAFNVSIPKDESAGGLIAVNDWVDVAVTTEVGRTDSAERQSRTAVVARGVQVIAKRDTLWSVFAPLNPDEDIKYTLSANPYRAALVDYAKTIGFLTLIPVSAAETKGYEERLKKVKTDPSKPLMVTHPDPESFEYKEEARKLATYSTGGVAVGVETLAELMELQPIAPPPARPKPYRVEVFNGATRAEPVVFQAPEPVPSGPAARYTFTAPPKDDKADAKKADAARTTSTPAVNPRPQPRPQPKQVVVPGATGLVPQAPPAATGR